MDVNRMHLDVWKRPLRYSIFFKIWRQQVSECQGEAFMSKAGQHPGTDDHTVLSSDS